MGLNGFLLPLNRYHCKIHPDFNMPGDVCSHWSSFGFQVKGFIEVSIPDSRCSVTLTALLSYVLPLCYMLCPSLDFARLCAYPLLPGRKEGRKENIKACDFDAGSVATCITRRGKKTTCCCLGIDINWPFQSLPNSELLSALPLFIYMLLKVIHIQHAEWSRYACVMWLEAPHYSKQYPLKIKTSIFWPNNWNETWIGDYQDAH